LRAPERRHHAGVRCSGPADQIADLLPSVAAFELLDVILGAFEEGSERAASYAEAAGEEATPYDVALEGLGFATLLRDLIATLTKNPRAIEAWHRTRWAEDVLRDHVARGPHGSSSRGVSSRRAGRRAPAQPARVIESARFDLPSTR
jgi:hypothetical protein